MVMNLLNGILLITVKVYTIPKGFADQINGGTESQSYVLHTPHFVKNEGIILNPDEPESVFMRLILQIRNIHSCLLIFSM